MGCLVPLDFSWNVVGVRIRLPQSIMKKLFSLIVVLAVVGCGRETPPPPPAAEPVLIKPVAEVAEPEPPAPPPISIWDAARGGDVEAVRGHIASGTLLNGPDETNPLKQTPLHCAVESGHKAVAELLLANGAGINAKRADGLTALDIVLKADPEASDEDRAVRKAIAGMLVRNGATAAKHK
ncbi:MAG: hypothetical protein ACI8QI_000951 [Limisphaerales bacterium]